VQIDIYSDVVCPWCYIGKRRLDAALAGDAVRAVDIHWHAYQLNPDLPPEGMDRRRYLEAKFGSEAVARMQARLGEVGLSVGIEFQFDKITRAPNTFNAHRLMGLARATGHQDRMADKLFQAYFIEGRDIGAATVLAELAAEAGLAADIPAWLAGDAETKSVHADLAAAGQLGISGVPFYVFDQRYAVAGAQAPEVFMQALQAAAGAPPH